MTAFGLASAGTTVSAQAQARADEPAFKEKVKVSHADAQKTALARHLELLEIGCLPY